MPAQAGIQQTPPSENKDRQGLLDRPPSRTMTKKEPLTQIAARDGAKTAARTGLPCGWAAVMVRAHDQLPSQ
jgi:hypothetical protein